MLFGVRLVVPTFVGAAFAALQPELTERELPSPSSTWIEAELNACGMFARAVAGVLPNSTELVLPPALLVSVKPVVMVPLEDVFTLLFVPGR